MSAEDLCQHQIAEPAGLRTTRWQFGQQIDQFAVCRLLGGGLTQHKGKPGTQLFDQQFIQRWRLWRGQGKGCGGGFRIAGLQKIAKIVKRGGGECPGMSCG